MKARYIACSTIATVSLTSVLVTDAAAQVLYTAEQAVAGVVAYEQHCAECHLQTLVGSFEAPELAGQNFLSYWGGRSVEELMEAAISMPPGEEGSLDGAVYANIVAYLLERNGFPAGTAELIADATGTLEGSTGPRDTPAPPTRAAGPASTPNAGFGGRGGTSAGGTSTFNAVIDFRPVTDEELTSPDPGDWLMYRRTLDGQGYSPLDQVNRENVSDLRLAWLWAMDDGFNQPTPLVRGGVMYLTHPMNTIQALDAATGELLWEYRRTFPEGYRAGFSQLRSIAIYEDKIFVPTKDAWLVALDARTGEIAWETQIADYQQGYTNVVGPIIARG